MKISDNDIKKICSPGIYKAGTEYFREGRVHIRVRSKDSVVASVDSDKLYTVHIGFDEGGNIADTFCTCPYFQTMGANCRHIAAVLKTRQAELTEGDSFSDDNDRTAERLCREYQQKTKTPLHVGFVFNINANARRECTYSMSVQLGDGRGIISGIESFLAAYITDGEYKLSKHKTYRSSDYEIGAYERHILDILAEAYQNKAAGSPVYTPRLTAADFGSCTARRLMPLLNGADCRFVINGMAQPELVIREENPDILVDVTATDDNINISIPQSGLAIVPDGSWFFYEGDIYATDSEWRGWFMPLYRALSVESRTQLDFKGANSIDFAINVLPRLRGQKGVVAQGLENVIVDDRPTFSVYLDRFGDGVTAAVIAAYGNIRLRLPEPEEQEKIIVRDTAGEKYLLSLLGSFEVTGQSLYLNDSAALYDFFTDGLVRLSSCAEVHTSAAFDEMRTAARPALESTVSYNRGTGLLEVGFKADVSADEIAGILHAIRHKSKFYRMKNGAFLDIDGSLAAFEVLGGLDFSYSELKDGKKPLSRYHALYLSGAAEKGAVKADESFTALIDEIRAIRADIPAYLDEILRGYQKDGVHWLKQLSELGFGGILADDMGLGKTLEVIAFVMSEKKSLPALVVAPSALTYNWLSEIHRFAPGARAEIIDGTKEERLRLLENIADCDFVITSYPLMRRDITEYARLEFSYCFIDEAQHIKNPKTLSAKAVKRIKSGGCFALSGTPVENSLTELWSIFDFIMPGYLPPHRQFEARYERPISRDGDSAAADSLRAKIKPFILRRMKYEVLSELPEKIENTVYAELAPGQKKLYMAYLAIARREVPSLADSGDSMRILSLLMRLRQICCHPSLVDAEHEGESGKLELLEELVNQGTSAGHRILIFSQFTSMLAIIRERLENTGHSCFYLDGHTPPAVRSSMAERFNSGERSVFLVSLKAGGTGLNLIGADMVIHYDPWWNPAVTDQASDRAYRIGQTRAVQVIRLAAGGTIEEQILKLQEKKRSLAEDVIRTNSSTLASLTKEELLGLFES